MKEFSLPSAEHVHYVVDKARVAGLGVALAGGYTGNLAILLSGTIGWRVSFAADKFAMRRIESNGMKLTQEDPSSNDGAVAKW